MTDKDSAMGQRKGRMGGSTTLLILLAIVIIGFLWTYISYTKAQKELSALTDPNIRNELSQQETAALLEKVGKLMVLPANEEPVVATIQDVEVLATTQDFYKDAKNGQKLMIYSASRKAIIYDEATNKLVNVGPVIIQGADGQPATLIRADGKIAVEVRNGSKQTDKGIVTRDSLMSEPTFNLFRLGKAANSDYTSTIIVDLTGGTKAELVKKMTDILGVTAVTELPAGERPSEAEVLVIVGNS